MRRQPIDMSVICIRLMRVSAEALTEAEPRLAGHAVRLSRLALEPVLRELYVFIGNTFACLDMDATREDQIAAWRSELIGALLNDVANALHDYAREIHRALDEEEE